MTLAYYKMAIDAGTALEQACLFLLANGLYITWYMTLSLQGLAHLLMDRQDEHEMWETRQFAEAMKVLSFLKFPKSMFLLLQNPDLKFLRWFYQHSDFGPADWDMRDNLKSATR